MRNLLRAHRAFRARGRPDDALLAAAIGTATLGLVVLGMSCDWHHFPMKIWWMTIALGLVLRRIAEGELEEVAPEPILPVDVPVARALAPAAGRLPDGS